MATLSFGVVGPNQNWTTSLQISDTDSPRIIAWLMSPASGYGTVTENVQSTIPDASWSPGEGQTEADRPTVQVQQWVTRPASPEEATQNFAKATLAALLGSTVAWERSEAARIAAEAVAPIEVAA
jgi:hypothetical protein